MLSKVFALVPLVLTAVLVTAGSSGDDNNVAERELKQTLFKSSDLMDGKSQRLFEAHHWHHHGRHHDHGHEGVNAGGCPSDRQVNPSACPKPNEPGYNPHKLSRQTCTTGTAGQFQNYHIAVQFCPGSDVLSLHGVWPNYASGSEVDGYEWPQYCTDDNGQFKRFNLEQLKSDEGLVSDMQKYWTSCPPGSSKNCNCDATTQNFRFWEHEWERHGSCSGFEQNDYFRQAVDLVKDQQKFFELSCGTRRCPGHSRGGSGCNGAGPSGVVCTNFDGNSWTDVQFADGQSCSISNVDHSAGVTMAQAIEQKDTELQAWLQSVPNSDELQQKIIEKSHGQ